MDAVFETMRIEVSEMRLSFLEQLFQKSKFHTEASTGGAKKTICVFGTFCTFILSKNDV